jgi:hypothetical protein
VRIIPAQWLADPLAHICRTQLADLFLDCFICNALPLFDTDAWVRDFENAMQVVGDRSSTT